MVIWIKKKFIELKDNSKLFINDVKQQLTPIQKNNTQSKSKLLQKSWRLCLF